MPWSATGVSSEQQQHIFTHEKEETVLEAGIMWHKMTRVSKERNIKSEITSFVSVHNPNTEVMLVKLTNIGTQNIKIIPMAAVPIYGRSADNIRDHRHVTSLLNRTRVRKEGIIVEPTLTFDERGHQKNHLLYSVLGCDMDGNSGVDFYPCQETFIGEGGSFETPAAVYCRDSSNSNDNSNLDGYEAMGGIEFAKTTLISGESREFNATKRYWLNQINVHYKSGNKDFDNWMNWVNFQPILRRIYGCSFLPHHDYGKGGRGWRDLWQDCLALLIMASNKVGKMLVDNYQGVRIDGSNATIIGANPGEFLADRNHITRVWMDHGMWPFMTTMSYIHQTGDFNILFKEIPYFNSTSYCLL